MALPATLWPPPRTLTRRAASRASFRPALTDVLTQDRGLLAHVGTRERENRFVNVLNVVSVRPDSTQSVEGFVLPVVAGKSAGSLRTAEAVAQPRASARHAPHPAKNRFFSSSSVNSCSPVVGWAMLR